MSTILAIDTTSEHGSLALLRDRQIVEEIGIHAPDGFAHLLFGEIEALLDRHQTAYRDIHCFASTAGPGSFTGVRIGLTAVKGLAEAAAGDGAAKVVAVSNLQALAWFGSRPLRAAVMDARRGEIFGAVYDSSLRAVAAERAMPFEDWIAGLPAGDLEIVTRGYPVGELAWPVVEAPRALAGAVAYIAVARLAAGEAQDPAEVDANYVRRSDAEMKWSEVR